MNETMQACVAAAPDGDGCNVMAELRAARAELGMINAANRGGDPCQWERIKDHAMRLEARVADVVRQRDSFEALLREIEVPGVLIAGEVRINYDLRDRIQAALPKE